jgi:hypothetical protein
VQDASRVAPARTVEEGLELNKSVSLYQRTAAFVGVSVEELAGPIAGLRGHEQRSCGVEWVMGGLRRYLKSST